MREWQIKIASILFIILSGWWAFLQFTNRASDLSHNYFSDIYGSVALVGGIGGLIVAKRWGAFKSVFGKSIIFFSLGLISQEFGQLSYSYYFYIRNIDVPYPSIGDIGFFGSIPLYIIGVVYLARASGVTISLKSLIGQLQVIIVPLIVLAMTYFIFLQNYASDWTQPLNIFLDFGYPFGEAIYISLALLTFILSRKTLGGVMKYRVLMVLMALCIQYLADFTFLYQAKNGSWEAGGINDFMYLIAYFSLTLALLNLDVQSIKKSLEKGE